MLVSGVDNLSSYETVIELVRAWPAAQRFALVQEVLATLAPEALGATQHRPTLTKALELLATDRPAMSDDEIAQLLAERRQECFDV